MKKIILLTSIVTAMLTLTGCGSITPEANVLITKNSKSPAMVYQYNKVMEEMQWDLEDVENYVVIPVPDGMVTEEWYARLTFLLWNNDLEK